MKTLLTTAVFAAFFALSVSTQAQMKPLKLVTFDSLAADSVNAPQTIATPTNVEGWANNSNVVIANPGEWVFAQFFHGGSTPIDFQNGAVLHFYWNRPSNDQSRMWFILRKYVGDWINLDGPGDTVFVTESTGTGMATMTVNGTGFNTVEVWRDTSSNAAPVYLDAIVLVQHGTVDSVGGSASVAGELAEASGFTCYPNPFVATSGTMIHPLGQSSGATYVVMDLLGREIMRVDETRETHLTLPSSGTYFVRRRIGNDWSGAPLRISAE